MRIEANRIYFRNCKPSSFDSLGEIEWVSPLWCPVCGDITPQEVRNENYAYDGFSYETPVCRICGKTIIGVPVDRTERRMV